LKDLLTNPVVIRALLTFVLALAMLFFGVAIIRRMRTSISDEGQSPKRATGDQSGFALEAYHGVIQRLKEQERGQNAADIDHEHHGVAPLRLRQQFREGVEQRLPEDGLGHQRTWHHRDLRHRRCADLGAHAELLSDSERISGRKSGLDARRSAPARAPGRTSRHQ